MNHIDLAYAFLVLLLAYTVMGITGFGSALIAVPLLAWKWPLPEVVALVILLDVPASSLHAVLNRRQVRWESVQAMLPGMAAGTLLGLWLIGSLDKRWPLLLLGLYIAWVGLRSLRSPASVTPGIKPTAYHLGSALAGMIEVMFATAGPIVVTLLQKRLTDIREIRATVPMGMVVAGSIALMTLLPSSHADAAQTLGRWVVAFPVSALSVFIGNRVAGHIPLPLMRRLMALLLVCSGVALMQNFWH